MNKIITVKKKNMDYIVEIPKGTTTDDLFLGLTSFLVQFEKFQKDNGHDYTGDNFLDTLRIYYRAFTEE